MTCPRERLPDRRALETREAVFRPRFGEAVDLTVSMGFADDDPRRLAEVFIKVSRPRSDLALIGDDFAVLMSALLQRGESPAGIAHLLGRAGGRPASIAGCVADLMAEVEAAP